MGLYKYMNRVVNICDKSSELLMCPHKRPNKIQQQTTTTRVYPVFIGYTQR